MRLVNVESDRKIARLLAFMFSDLLKKNDSNRSSRKRARVYLLVIALRLAAELVEFVV